MDLAIHVQGTVISSAPRSLSDGAATMAQFLGGDPNLTDTLARYLDTVACDLQESAQAQRDGYATQRAMTREHFRRRRRARKKHKKASRAASFHPAEDNTEDQEEGKSKKKRKKMQQHQQDHD